ncbi:glycosyltransferase family 2 protein [Methyloceanibacter marginalis]|nr:glycosyltransferase family 2 protein [Methyloceanibacter marginalis]
MDFSPENIHPMQSVEPRPDGQKKKLIIQIPCLNEAETLPVTLACLPRQVPGYDVVEWLVIDDGCTDNTVQVAKAHGVDHIVSLGTRRGLAVAFIAGIEASLKLGAHTIVNTDADNQYRAEYISELVRPILDGSAQIVVGARPIQRTEDFSWLKRRLQRLGSWVVRVASNTDIPDAPSGFRAIYREAAMQLYAFNAYTYTLETIIQAGRKNIPITWVPVETNGPTRPSRLISSIPRYVWRSLITILRIFIVYKPARFFGMLSLIVLVPGLIAICRFLVFYALGDGGGHLQSLILGGSLVAVSAILLVTGIIADLIAANRRLLEDIRLKLWRQELGGPRP